ncbi:GlcNAc-transferase family protein [uncultured Massilia sp.]|uniref:GlcNAc-transferase family protein n=1 Tax=uncultured Massilia sp. TaxID=169973 RepID=UPI0025FE8F2C|nr:GlcNAc-transferase family protein [uncultured Massilia sp.]
MTGIATHPTIFVSLASYLDPMLFFTLNDALAKAVRPDLLSFGVVDQHLHDQRAAIAALPFAQRVRYLHVHPEDTLGVSWARSAAFSLYDGEAFLLQVDSHTLFEHGWDEQLRALHGRLLARSAKPIVSTYPYRFDMVDGVPVYTPGDGRTALVLRPHPQARLTPDDAVLRFAARHLFTSEPVMGCHVSAGFLFARGSFVEEVPYDPYLYFHGEEQSLAVRAFTRGWDIFHPLTTPVYHLYKTEGTPYATHHWHGAADERRAFRASYLTDRARLRLNRLLMGDGLPGAYGLGQARTMAQYRELSGIDYAAQTIADPFGGQLC